MIEEVEHFINLFVSNNIDKFDINKISITKIKFFNELLSAISLNNLDIPSNLNYKSIYYFKIYSYIVNYYINNYTKTNDELNEEVFINRFLSKLTCLFKGHILLQKMNKITESLFEVLNLNNINYFISLAVEIGTFNTVIYWLNFNNNNNNNLKHNILNLNNEILEKVITKSIYNSDDRLFKFIMKEIIGENILNISNYIDEMIKLLFFAYIPVKYTLKRIKLLSKYYNLQTNNELLLYYCTNIKVLLKLTKFYNFSNLSYKSINCITNNFCNQNTNSTNDYYNSFYNILQNDNDKDRFSIISNSKNIKLPYINKNFVEKEIINNYQYILLNLPLICENYYYEYNFIIKILQQNMLFNKGFIDKTISYYSHLIIYTRFLIIPIHLETNMRNNRVLHLLRKVCKKRYRLNLLNKRIISLNVIKELETYEPKNKPVLLKGSIKYQLNKQKFTTIPPRHIFPNEIVDEFLLKEKADGINTQILPNTIYPKFINYEILGEYIEDYELYLIYDINIPNTTILERYNILRNMHPLTKNKTIKTITNFNEFNNLLEEENNILIEYCKDFRIKWYPKVACIYNNINDVVNNVIIKTNIYKSIYNNDGVIITPLNGNRELKVKPKEHMTIDLLYNNNKFMDREGNEISIEIGNIKLNNNKIYRCYPKFNDNDIIYVAKEYRYDKNKPNTKNIINIIKCLVNYNWEKIIDINKYYEIHNRMDNKILLMIKEQGRELIKNIELLGIEYNSNILDLGCGYGKLIPLICKYNPKLYLGMDYDINQLSKGLRNYDNNQNVYLFNYNDLSKDWENNWCVIENYNYVICNFSIMHFMTDKFWENLNKYTKPKTKFLFNIVIECNYYFNNSFIKTQDDKTIYKFEWVHKEIKEEPFIKETELNNNINKYGWKKIYENIPKISKEYNLVNCYKWFIIEKE